VHNPKSIGFVEKHRDKRRGAMPSKRESRPSQLLLRVSALRVRPALGVSVRNFGENFGQNVTVDSESVRSLRSAE
jgi:hypothetical protein